MDSPPFVGKITFDPKPTSEHVRFPEVTAQFLETHWVVSPSGS